MKATNLFDLLDDWRYLPAYQLERRADIFFALYLDKILGNLKNTTVDLIIPEFPLRLGTLLEENPNINSSFKIDYLVYSKTQNRVYLIELKTDLRSLRSEQDKYYDKAVIIGLNAIVDGIIKIYNKTRQKVKYEHLLNKLIEVKWLKRDKKALKNISSNIKLEKIYIQPLNPGKLNFIISFDDVIKSISDTNDQFTLRFIQSLEKWKTDTNNAKR